MAESTPQNVGYRLHLEPPDGPRRFVVKTGVNLIGSDPSCDVRLRDYGVSRRHATITHRGDDLHLADLGSKNGTTVNGARVLNSRVWADDTIGISTLRLRLEAADPRDLDLAVTLESPPSSHKMGDPPDLVLELTDVVRPGIVGQGLHRLNRYPGRAP